MCRRDRIPVSTGKQEKNARPRRGRRGTPMGICLPDCALCLYGGSAPSRNGSLPVITGIRFTAEGCPVQLLCGGCRENLSRCANTEGPGCDCDPHGSRGINGVLFRRQVHSVYFHHDDGSGRHRRTAHAEVYFHGADADSADYGASDRSRGDRGLSF